MSFQFEQVTSKIPNYFFQHFDGWESGAYRWILLAASQEKEKLEDNKTQGMVIL